MASIICYGDSNTYGHDPEGIYGGRYPAEVRWTSALEADGYTVVNEGMCGRMIPVDPVLMDAIAKKFSAYEEPDVLIVMLGGNNILHEEISVEEIAEKMDVFLASLNNITWFKPEKTLLISPVRFEEGSWVWDGMIEKSEALGPYYEKVAKKHGIHFLNAGNWRIEKVFDGVHYSPKGHKEVGEKIASYIKEITK